MTNQQHADELLSEYQANRGRSMSENGEAFTPKEEAEIKAELIVRDAWLSVTEASNLFKADPVIRPFIARQIGDIKSMHTKLEILIGAIEIVSAKKRSAA